MLGDARTSRPSRAAREKRPALWGVRSPMTARPPDRTHSANALQLALPSEGSGVLNFNHCGHHDCLGKLGPALVLQTLRARFDSVLLS